jgi:hypothetical protein
VIAVWPRRPGGPALQSELRSWTPARVCRRRRGTDTESQESPKAYSPRTRTLSLSDRPLALTGRRLLFLVVASESLRLTRTRSGTQSCSGCPNLALRPGDCKNPNLYLTQSFLLSLSEADTTDLECAAGPAATELKLPWAPAAADHKIHFSKPKLFFPGRK